MATVPATPPPAPPTPFLERALLHWKTTLAGAGVSAGMLYVVANSFGCTLPTDPSAWMKWGVAALPLILGAASKDH
jgi:hypothetical protein